MLVSSYLAQELGGTLEETTAEIQAAGGKGIAVACDHADDDQASALHLAPFVHLALFNVIYQSGRMVRWNTVWHARYMPHLVSRQRGHDFHSAVWGRSCTRGVVTLLVLIFSVMSFLTSVRRLEVWRYPSS